MVPTVSRTRGRQAHHGFPSGVLAPRVAPFARCGQCDLQGPEGRPPGGFFRFSVPHMLRFLDGSKPSGPNLDFQLAGKQAAGGSERRPDEFSRTTEDRGGEYSWGRNAIRASMNSNRNSLIGWAAAASVRIGLGFPERLAPLGQDEMDPGGCRSVCPLPFRGRAVLCRPAGDPPRHVTTGDAIN